MRKNIDIISNKSLETKILGTMASLVTLAVSATGGLGLGLWIFGMGTTFASFLASATFVTLGVVGVWCSCKQIKRTFSREQRRNDGQNIRPEEAPAFDENEPRLTSTFNQRTQPQPRVQEREPALTSLRQPSPKR